MSTDHIQSPSDDLRVARKSGIVQAFGLDVRVAILAVVVDFLVFGGDIATAGLLYPVELVASVVLGFITYRMQRAWYGDDHDSALIKALVVGLLTAIPVPVTVVIAGPAGLVGLLNPFRRK